MIFYNVVAIIVAVFMLSYGIKLCIDRLFKKSIGFYVISILYLGLGIYGFFIPENMEYILIIGMIVLCVIALALFRLLFNNPKNKDVKK